MRPGRFVLSALRPRRVIIAPDFARGTPPSSRIITRCNPRERVMQKALLIKSGLVAAILAILALPLKMIDGLVN